MSNLTDITNRIIHEILSHAQKPITSDEAVIPLLIDVQKAQEVLHNVAVQLRARNEAVWISKDRLTMIHKQVRMFIDPAAIHNPTSLQDFVFLTAVMPEKPEITAYAREVLDRIVSSCLTDARYAGYQGYVLTLDDDEVDADED